MKSELKNIKDLVVLENEPLSNHTTYKIGGKTKFLLSPTTKESLSVALEVLRTHKVPLLVIGQGSNLLFPDEDFDGVVIKINPKADFLNFIELKKMYGRDFVSIGAGTLKSELVRFALEKAFSNFIFLTGIPGTIGGGIKMNAGTSEGNFESIIK